MNWQILIVAIIIFGALFYIGKNVWRKTKAFSGKNSCGTGDCGCGTKARSRKAFVQPGK